MVKLITRVILIMLILIFRKPIFAVRPLSTDDAWTVEEGNFELEIGYNFIKSNDSSESGIAIQLKHGLTKRTDVSFVVPYGIQPECGLKAAECGAKFMLAEAKGIFPTFSLTFGYSPGSEEYKLNGILTKELNPFTLHFNFGYEVLAQQQGKTLYSMALEYQIIEKLRLMGEVLGEEGGFWEALIGGSWQILEPLAVDLGFGMGLSTQKLKFTSGLTYSF